MGESLALHGAAGGCTGDLPLLGAVGIHKSVSWCKGDDAGIARTVFFFQHFFFTTFGGIRIWLGAEW